MNSSQIHINYHILTQKHKNQGFYEEIVSFIHFHRCLQFADNFEKNSQNP